MRANGIMYSFVSGFFPLNMIRIFIHVTVFHSFCCYIVSTVGLSNNY